MDFVKAHLDQSAIRTQFADFLQAISSPRSVRDEKCLEQLGEIAKTVIDLLYEEKDNQNLKELNSIMHASQLFFTFRDDNASGNRLTKVFLSAYIIEHEIWQDENIWRLCLQRIINAKFHDAVKAQ